MEPFDLILRVVMGDLIQQGVTQSDYSLTGSMIVIVTIAAADRRHGLPHSLYVDTRVCALEAKVKRAGGETEKAACDLDPSDHGRLTAAGLVPRSGGRRRGARRLADPARPGAHHALPPRHAGGT